MKLVVAVVKPFKIDDVKNVLKNMGVAGMTLAVGILPAVGQASVPVAGIKLKAPGLVADQRQLDGQCRLARRPGLAPAGQQRLQRAVPARRARILARYDLRAGRDGALRCLRSGDEQCRGVLAAVAGAAAALRPGDLAR